MTSFSDRVENNNNKNNKGEVPTAANLNLYRGWNSCVGWHRDDEPLFGKCGDAKLIVSVSLGSSAFFKWRRLSCPDDEGHLCCLGHGDIIDGYQRYVPLGQTTCFLLSSGKVFFFWLFWLLLCVLCMWEVLCWSTPSCVHGLGY